MPPKPPLGEITDRSGAVLPHFHDRPFERSGDVVFFPVDGDGFPVASPFLGLDRPSVALHGFHDHLSGVKAVAQ